MKATSEIPAELQAVLDLSAAAQEKYYAAVRVRYACNTVKNYDAMVKARHEMNDAAKTARHTWNAYWESVKQTEADAAQDRDRQEQRADYAALRAEM